MAILVGLSAAKMKDGCVDLIFHRCATSVGVFKLYVGLRDDELVDGLVTL